MFYALVRSGRYAPRLHRYAPGDYVYHTKGQATHSLDTSHYDYILRVKSLLPSGNLLLTGRCGRTLSASPLHCAPCHLPNIDPTMDAHLPRPSKHHACQICLSPARDEEMILCDSCNDGYHYDCVGLPVCPGEEDPPWFCPICLNANPDPAAAPLPDDPDSTKPARRKSPYRSSAQKQTFLSAQQFDNSKVYRKIGSRTDTSTVGIARLRTDPASLNINYPLFNVTYPDGTTETDVRLTPISRRQVCDPSAPFVGTVSATSWDLRQHDQLTTALPRLMPGAWSALHLSAMQLQLDRYCANPASLPVSPTLAVDVSPLLELIDFTCMGGLVDPFLGPGSVVSALLQSFPHSLFLTNDLNPAIDADMCYNPLSPSFYYNLHSIVGVDSIVSRPPFSLLDIVLPLAIPAVRVLACFLVPGHYLTTAHPARASFLRSLASQNRLHIVWTSPRGLAGRRHAWIIVFATASLRSYFAGHSFAPVV